MGKVEEAEVALTSRRACKQVQCRKSQEQEPRKAGSGVASRFDVAVKALKVNGMPRP